jgi:glutathione S-transferase
VELLIHHRASPVVRKVLLVAAELGIDLPVREIAWRDPEARTAYSRLNPNDNFPTLLDDELVLWESNAIALHLCRAAGGLLPDAPAAWSEMMRWLFFESAHLGLAALRLTSGRLSHVADTQKDVDEFHRRARILDGTLGDREWIAGDALSLADLVLAAPLTYARQADLPLRDHPALARWFARIEARPSWAATQP